jgi:excisionase family DNA binding protein
MKLSLLKRRNKVARLREEGLTYRDIGRSLGISGERVRQILRRKANCAISVSSPDRNEMLRISEVARILGLHPNTVRRWSDKGRIKSYRMGDRGDRRYRREDIDRFLNE